MQVSLENTTAIERRMTVGIPSDKVDAAVNQRLQEASRTVKINGFRPGKVPMSVVQKRYGAGIRQEVVGEMMRDAYMQALEEQKLQPAGYPKFEPKSTEAGADVEFVAVFEVYPEFTVGALDQIKVKKETAEVVDADIDQMISNLREQSAKWVESEKAAEEGDKVTIDYKGTVDGEAFEGGTAENATVQIGSKRMIPGFEEGLVGLKAGDTKTLDVNFPEDYQAENLKGKAAKFDVTVRAVAERELPEIDEAFFASYGVEGKDLDGFREELRKNMTREAANASSNKVKQQVVDQLVEQVAVEVPAALISNEVDRMRQEAVQRFGGGQNLDPSALPAELFTEQAKKRVQTGLIFAQIIKEQELEATDDQVRAKIEELAGSYQDPEQFIEYFMNNAEQKAQIESSVLEDQVVDKVLEQGQVEEATVSYEDAVKPPAQGAAAAAES